MSKINFFPLGGMDENEKACYVLEVDGDCYLINLGISIPPISTLGIKKSIPYMEWVKKNERNIKGIFIGNSSYKNVGSIQYCYDYIKNIPIFTSKLGSVILEAHFNKKSMQKYNNFTPLKIKVLESLKTYNLGKIKVTPFKVTSCMPDTFGFVISTGSENIIYIDEFIVYNNFNSTFSNDLNKLPLITYNQKNLLLISNVGNSSRNSGFTSPSFKSKNFFVDLLARKNVKRLVVACHYHDIYNFLILAQIAKEKQLPFVIYNPVFINVFNEIVKHKYFDSSNLLVTPIHKINEIEKGIVVISTTRDRLYSKLFSIANNEDDILILKKSDTVVLGFRTEIGFEKMVAELLDAYSKLDIEAMTLPKSIQTMEASEDDHKYLVNLLKPKYVIPTLGKYYQFVKYANSLKEIGYSYDNVIKLYNGEIASFDNFNLVSSNKRMDIHEMYIGNQGLLTEGENIFKERQVMSESGIVFFSFCLNEDEKSFNSEKYELIQYAVTVDNESTKKQFNTIALDALNLANTTIQEMKKLDSKEIKNIVKKYISKQIDKQFEKNPIVIVMIS